MKEYREDHSQDFLRDGEMGAHIKGKDWVGTGLGPIERWPSILTSTLSICLTARFPMAIYWGPEGFLLYNDAWRPILGQKHPWAVGRPAQEVWPEIWDAIDPLLRNVRTTGLAIWRGDALLPMQRFGYTEECYFDYTFNPIRGEDEKVAGILNVVQETTYRVLNDRRAALLRELAARSGSAKNEQDAYRLAMAAMMTDSADIPFALLYRADFHRRTAHLAEIIGLPAGSSAAPTSVNLTGGIPDAEWPLADALTSGSSIMVDDLSRRFGPLPGGQWPEPTTQALVMPIVVAGEDCTSDFLIVGVNPRHSLDEEYCHFFKMVVSHLALALNNARTYFAERKRAEVLAELDRAKTAFFSNVSHEFRTPLTLMLGPVEELLAKNHTDLSPAAKSQLEIVNRNGLRLLRLVNNLLDFSRIEAGRVQARYEPTDLAAFTADLASAFRSATERAGLKLIVDCPPLSEPVYVDRDMWEKIVLNLLSNAFKFTFEGEIEAILKESDAWRVTRMKEKMGPLLPRTTHHAPRAT